MRNQTVIRNLMMMRFGPAVILIESVDDRITAIDRRRAVDLGSTSTRYCVSTDLTRPLVGTKRAPFLTCVEEIAQTES